MPLPPVPVFTPLADPAAVVTAYGCVRFTVLTDRLIRLEYSPRGEFEDRPSQVFWRRAQPARPFRQAVSASTVEIETEYLLLKYTPSRLGFTPLNLSITLKQSGVTWRYGTPAFRTGNLKGTARTLDMATGATRLGQGLLSKAGWAVVDDSRSLVFNASGWLEARQRGRTLALNAQKDVYFFGYGRDVRACLRDYTAVSGAAPMIPRFILGNWWSRYWAYTQAELQALMEEFRAHEVPLSVCIIDMDWHITRTGNASNGWTGYTWNRQLFPDPPGLIRWLHSQGLRTALNLHPARGVYPIGIKLRGKSTAGVGGICGWPAPP